MQRFNSGSDPGRGRTAPLSGSSAAGSFNAGVCTAVIGSMTQAMKAQSLLAEAAIHASLTKISSGRTSGGCAYGIDFPCTQSRNVRMILQRAGVRVREYLPH